ncbi:MAG: hypothetical protein AAF721_09510 [Myxococcota bacterium]
MASALLVGLVTLSIAASQAAPSRVVVLPPEVAGDAPANVATKFATAAEAAVGSAGAEVVPAPDGCKNDKCGAEAAGPQGYVLTTKIDARGSDYTIATRLVDAGGNVVDEQSEPCEICTYEEAAEALQAMAEKAVTPVAEVAAPPAPPPPTPDPASSEPAPEPRDGMSAKTLGSLGFAAVGVGAGALVGGVVLLVLNDRPVRSQCEGDQVDIDGDCELRYNTLGGGAGLAVAGAASIGVGLLLLSKARGGSTKGRVDVSAAAGGLRLRF